MEINRRSPMVDYTRVGEVTIRINRSKQLTTLLEGEMINTEGNFSESKISSLFNSMSIVAKGVYS